ncbi:BnaC02g32890D [Brassica napus]|uniref:BnaC02g32890D protein n=1 Tax=Brassica napus TaxID=3708 RepID=A0A078I3E0_BRANA|nr:BnaC02g32890D [Brassica napus]
MTKSKPNKKENKSKTSEEPTHRKPQQETIATDFQRISKIHDRVFVGVSGFATDVQKLLEWWNDFFYGHGSFHPNPSELGRLCSFEDVNSLLFIFKCFESTL